MDSCKLDAVPIDFSFKYWYKFDEVTTDCFKGWVFFESSDVFVKRELFCFPFIYDYERIHVVCHNGFIKFGRSLSQSSAGVYDYAMNLAEAKIYLLPVCLQIKFKDKKKKYIIMMERLEDYKFMIRTIKVQRQQRFKEKEMYLCERIRYLHREQAKYVAIKKNLPCDVLYNFIHEETNRKTETVRTSGNFLRLKCLAKRQKISNNTHYPLTLSCYIFSGMVYNEISEESKSLLPYVMVKENGKLHY
ncbi:hypothetical protein Btru_064826 [Bulinus truncatus]|nr:hypothetical protein Btru_064826 [Bulinus truncatus]